MSLAGIDATGKDSQLLAIVMLQNFKLDESTWNSLTIQLVGNSDRRMQVEESAPTSLTVTRTRLDDIKRQVLDLHTNLSEDLRALTCDIAAVYQGSSSDVAAIKKAAQSVANPIKVFVIPPAVETYNSSKNSKIFLNDLHKALSSLGDPSPPPTKSDAASIAE